MPYKIYKQNKAKHQQQHTRPPELLDFSHQVFVRVGMTFRNSMSKTSAPSSSRASQKDHVWIFPDSMATIQRAGYGSVKRNSNWLVPLLNTESIWHNYMSWAEPMCGYVVRASSRSNQHGHSSLKKSCAVSHLLALTNSLKGSTTWSKALRQCQTTLTSLRNWWQKFKLTIQ